MMPTPRESPAEIARRYGITFLVGSAAFLLRLVFEEDLDGSAFIIYLLAMLLGAWLGGLGPTLLLQTSLLFSHSLFLSSAVPGNDGGMTTKGLVSVTAFYSVGIIVALLSEARKAAAQRLRQQNAEIAQKKAELSATISGISDGVLLSDERGRVQFLNPVAEFLTGWTARDADGEPIGTVLSIFEHGEQPLPSDALTWGIRTGKSVREGRMLKLVARDGRHFPITYSATPIRGEGNLVTGCVFVVRDESDRQQAEEQLLDMNRRKDDFLATLAHELRNPLAPISTGLQLMKLSQGDGRVLAEVHEILERQIQHMVRLVDDLLDVSRITRGKLQLRRSPINMARVVQQAVETMRPQIEEAQHLLVLHLPDAAEPIDADPDRLMQITCNLIHNAVKFTPPGGRIEVQVEQTADEARLVVTDNGQGIGAENLQAIFEMFNQGSEHPERGHSGLGIGLTLARRLAELHGGTIDVHSAGRGHGSTFRVRLPTSGRFALVEPTDSSRPHSTHPRRVRRVLLVDDNRDAVEMLQIMVRSLGHQTAVAHDGVEALELAERFRPEVILLDLGMPRMNGYDAARRIRRTEWGREILLIALTGWGQERDRQRTRECGFDEHVLKPVDLETLRCCLERQRVADDRRERESPLAVSSTPS